jgi:hypothetical protein
VATAEMSATTGSACAQSTANAPAPENTASELQQRTRAKRSVSVSGE